MNKNTTLAMAVALTCAAAPAAFADSGTMSLTGVGNGVTANGVYVTPYTGVINTPLYNYSGYVICDDYTTDSTVGSQWNVKLTDGANVAGGAAKFVTSNVLNLAFGPQTFSLNQQQSYDAAGYLANQLIANTVANPNQAQALQQTDTAFAIWNLFDNNNTGYSTTNERNLEIAAIQAALNDSSGNAYSSNITIATASPINASQEFLVVKAPEMNASGAGGALTLLFGSVAVMLGRRESRAPARRV